MSWILIPLIIAELGMVLVSLHFVAQQLAKIALHLEQIDARTTLLESRTESIVGGVERLNDTVNDISWPESLIPKTDG